MRGPFLAALVGVVVLASGACTESNPGFQGDRGTAAGDMGHGDWGATGDAAPRELGPPGDGPAPLDHGPGRDTLPWPDLMPAPDLVPSPDTVPWQCSTDADCSDGHPCTLDTCSAANKCEHTLQNGWCLIGVKCFKTDEPNPANTCEACLPGQSTSSWSTLSDGTGCAPDSFGCTQDVCKGGACTHPLVPGTCLIDGTCRAGGDPNPQSPCETCQPAKSTTQWSQAPNGTPCPLDGLTCTTDQCQGGVCTHPVNPGWCLISSNCVAEGDAQPGDACNECVSDRSQTAWTFVAGKPCSGASGVADMCFDSKCRGWTETLYEPGAANNPTATALNAVSYIPPAGAVWAAGEFSSGTASEPQGVLTQLGASATVKPTVTKAALYGLHYRLAVGAAGQAWYHDGKAWTTNASISTFLGNVARRGVYGYDIAAGNELFFLGGVDDGSPGGVAGVVRCAVTSLGVTACSNHSGFVSGTLLGSVFAAKSNLGLQGPAWAISTDLPSGEPEDIYAYPGIGSSWSRNPPAGCQDSGNTPCSSTSGEFRDMFGSSPSDIWVVGSYGNLLHYDGSAWTRLQNQFQYQSYQVMTGVFSSPADKLVTIVSYRTAGSYRWVSLYNRNTDLQRWYGPITIRSGQDNGIDELRDIGGQGYGNLWMVGRRQDSAAGSSKTKGWILHLQ